MPPPPEAQPQDGKNFVSLREVAAAAGVSRMAVSRAFRADAAISSTLRARVLKVAASLGYRPDPLVTELMTSFVKRRPVTYRETLAAIWWEERWIQTVHPNGFASDIRLGIQKAANKHGCRVDDFIWKSNTPRTLARMLKSRRIKGVILTPPTSVDDLAPALEWEGLTVVTIGCSLREPAFHRVHPHHYASMVKVVEILRARGFKRPVLLARTDLEERMQRAYTAAFLAQGAGPPERIRHCLSPKTPGLPAWLRGRRPDVVIGDEDGWWPVVRAAMDSLGRPPVFVSLDVQDRAGVISGIYQHAGHMAESAVDMLVQARLRHDTGIPSEPLTLMTSGSWFEGTTISGAV